MRPRVWILTAGRVGDLKQMQVLAKALDCETETKHLEFRSKALTLWPFFAKLLLTAESRAAISGPPPDLVFAAESRTAAVALSIKSKVVCLGRPRGGNSKFGLIIATPQYELPRAANVLEINLPLTERQQPQPLQFNEHPRPHTLLLVGGTSAPFVINARQAANLCDDLAARVKQKGGTLFVSTSLRTGAAVDDVIGQKLGNGDSIFLWSRGAPQNPYRSFLATADECVVTADSVSMLTDSIVAGNPTLIYGIPEQWSWWHRLVRWLWQRARLNPDSMIARLFDWGILESRANRSALNQKLVEAGLVSFFGGGPSHPPAPSQDDDLRKAVARVLRLLGA
jgi:uncharacterized protein